MLIHDDVYHWDGWGGDLKLARGRCRLKIFDMRKGERKDVTLMRPIVVVVTDIPFEKRAPNQMTVKACASHVATCVVRDFNLDPHRMMWIEHYPASPETEYLRYRVEEHFDEVEFTWDGRVTRTGRWRTPSPPVETMVRQLLEKCERNAGDKKNKLEQTQT